MVGKERKQKSKWVWKENKRRCTFLKNSGKKIKDRNERKTKWKNRKKLNQTKTTRKKKKNRQIRNVEIK